MKLTLLIAIISSCLSVSAQTTKELVYRNYTVKDGLPSNEVYDVLQDDEGYMWFATDKGVSRFDGNKFENFSSRDGLTDNVVFQLYKDDVGKIWFVTKSNRLFYWENNQVNKFKYNSIIREKCIGNYFTNYLEIKKGVLEINIIGVGIYWFDENGLIKSRFEKKTEKIIIYNKDKTQNCFSVNGFRSFSMNHQFSVDSSNVTTSDTSFLVSNSSKLCRNADKNDLNSIYFGSNFFFYQNGKINYRVFKEFIQYVEIIDDSTINICLRNKGVKKVVITQDGYYEIDHTLKNYSVSKIFTDESQNSWITTVKSGVLLIDNNKVSSVKNYHEGTNYRSICQIGYGKEIIMNTQESLLFHNNGEIKKITTTKNYSDLIKIGNEIYFSSDLSLFKIDSSLNYTLKSKKYSASLKGGFIYKKDTFLYCSYALSKIENSNYRDVLNIGISKSIQFQDKIYLLAQNKIFEFNLDKIDDLGVNNEIDYKIDDICNYNDSIIFLSLNGFGVARIEEGRIKIIKINGRKFDFIDQLYHYKSDLFIRSNNSIAKLVRVNNDNYKYELILDGRNINYQINDLIFKNNNILLATNIGIVNIPIEKFKEQKSYFYLDEVLLESSSVPLNELNSLNYFQNNIQFKYKVVEYSKNEVNYRYRIKDTDPWSYTSENNFGFKNLKSDNYRLKLEYKLDGGNWITAFEKEFKILSPFWGKWWFYLVLFVLVLCIIFLIFRKQNFNQKRKAELALSALNSRQEALRSQMNPHFIFNSMNSIQSAILNKEYRQANNYLVGFSKYLRKTLNNSREELISLEEDIANIELYVKVEKFRFKDKFNFQVLLLDNLNVENYLVPPLIAQPFIENAILHGISPIEGNGEILYSIRKQENKLVFSIKDNGVGFKEKKKKHKSLGSKIVKERFKGFEEKYNIDLKIYIKEVIMDNKVKGVHVEYELPLIEKKQK